MGQLARKAMTISGTKNGNVANGHFNRDTVDDMAAAAFKDVIDFIEIMIVNGSHQNAIKCSLNIILVFKQLGIIVDCQMVAFAVLRKK